MDATYAAKCPFCNKVAKKGDNEQGYWDDSTIEPGILEPEDRYPYRCSLGLDCVIPEIYEKAINSEIISSSLIPKKD